MGPGGGKGGGGEEGGGGGRLGGDVNWDGDTSRYFTKTQHTIQNPCKNAVNKAPKYSKHRFPKAYTKRHKT